MSKFILTTSSTADLPNSYLEQHNVGCVRFSFLISDEEYKDDFVTSMPAGVFYNRLRNGEMSRTSMVNAASFEEFFRGYLDRGESILHIEFSSALSGSYQNAAVVAKKLNKEYADAKVIVIDSLCASLGLGLLVDYARRMRDEDKDLDETAAWVERNKLNVIHWFTVDDLDFLRRGGRVSGVSAFLGGMLKIKPVMDVNNEGRLIPLYKVRGRKKAIATMVEKMKADAIDPKNEPIFISHGDCMDDAKRLAGLIKEEWGADVQLINYVGSVIGSHSGPGTLALFYMGKKRT
ncbi:MAG: DegV family protein [Christensenellaceae bacterium]|nr:DegV family protein [Christensenellaceae bacterium]